MNRNGAICGRTENLQEICIISIANAVNRIPRGYLYPYSIDTLTEFVQNTLTYESINSVLQDRQTHESENTVRELG